MKRMRENPCESQDLGGWTLNPDRLRVFRDGKLTLGKLERFLQPWRLKTVKPVKRSSDDGNSSTAVPSKYSSDKLVILVPISENFLRLEQPDRIKIFRDFKFISQGRPVRLLQSFRFNKLSLLRAPTDGWSSYKLVHPWKISLSRFGHPMKLGVLTKTLESLRSRSLNLVKFCDNKYIWEIKYSRT